MDISEAVVRRKFRRPRRTLGFGQAAAIRFGQACAQYFGDDPTEHYVLRDPIAGRYSYRVRLKKPFPDEAEDHFSSSLQHIRNTFDQAVHAARSALSTAPVDHKNFPWSKDPSDLKGRLRHIDARLWEVFENFQPYPASKAHPGGDSLVRAIATMVNSKHDIGLEVDGFPSGIEIEGFSGGGGITATPNWDRVKRETIVCEWGENPNAMRKPPVMTFSVKIVNSDVPDGTRASDALAIFHDRALELIIALESRCITLLREGNH